MSNWYYADAERQRQGPLTADELAQRFHQGRLRLDTLVWRDGLADWQPLRDFNDELTLHQARAETFYVPVEPAVAMPASGTTTVYTESGARTDSPYAPPSATLTSNEAFNGGGEVVYAGFWKRVAAYLVDVFVIGIATQVVQLVVMGLFFGISASSMSNPETMFASSTGILFVLALYLTPLVMQAAYFAAFHASSKQATLGKMAVGIKMVGQSGRRISLAHAISRYFASWLSWLIMGIGCAMAAFTTRKQTLHDMLCHTLVVDKWAYTAHPEWQQRTLGTVTVVILTIFGALALLGLFFIAIMAGTLTALGH